MCSVKMGCACKGRPKCAAGKKAWYEKDPERFRKLYGQNYTLPTPPNTKE